MNWKTNRPEADTAPDTRRTHFKIELSTPTVNCLGKKQAPTRQVVGPEKPSLSKPMLEGHCTENQRDTFPRPRLCCMARVGRDER